MYPRSLVEVASFFSQQLETSNCCRSNRQVPTSRAFAWPKARRASTFSSGEPGMQYHAEPIRKSHETTAVNRWMGNFVMINHGICEYPLVISICGILRYSPTSNGFFASFLEGSQYFLAGSLGTSFESTRKCNLGLVSLTFSHMELSFETAWNEQLIHQDSNKLLATFAA